MKKLPLLFAAFLMLFSVAMDAQGKKKSETDLLREKLEEWTAKYADLPNSRDLNGFLELYTTDYNGTRSSYKITGKLERKPVDYHNLKGLIERILTMEDPRPLYEIVNIYNIGVQGRIAYASLEANFSLHEGDNLVAKGTEVQTLLFRKENGEWKIAQADILNLVDEQLKDICGCTIFSSSANEYISKVQRPTGQQYEEFLDMFAFYPLRDGNTRVMINTEEFTWLTNGELWRNYNESSNREKIGREKNQRKLVLMVLQDVLYKDFCRKIRPNN
ncbi:MAG: hypothetical protein AAF502_07430 [Bacteroidota bacterium]